MFYFGIPSYKRAHKQLTLEYLLSMGYEKEQIVIATQTKDDYKEYTERYGEKATVVYGEGSCVGDNRNNILNSLPKGVKIVMLDDDIKCIQELNKDGKLQDIKDKSHLNEVFNGFFDYCEKHNANIWGVYPVSNAYFMKRKIDNKNILAGFVLGVVNGTFLFNREFKIKEDYELCCRQIKTGYNCVRFNWITAKVKYKTNDGGCQDNSRNDVNLKCTNRLVEMYPNLVKMNTSKQGEVRYVGKRQ